MESLSRRFLGADGSSVKETTRREWKVWKVSDSIPEMLGGGRIDSICLPYVRRFQHLSLLGSLQFMGTKQCPRSLHGCSECRRGLMIVKIAQSDRGRIYINPLQILTSLLRTN